MQEVSRPEKRSASLTKHAPRHKNLVTYHSSLALPSVPQLLQQLIHHHASNLPGTSLAQNRLHRLDGWILELLLHLYLRNEATVH